MSQGVPYSEVFHCNCNILHLLYCWYVHLLSMEAVTADQHLLQTICGWTPPPDRWPQPWRNSDQNQLLHSPGVRRSSKERPTDRNWERCCHDRCVAVMQNWRGSWSFRNYLAILWEWKAVEQQLKTCEFYDSKCFVHEWSASIYTVH